MFKILIEKIIALAIVIYVAPCLAGDWPMWRCDAARSAQTGDKIPDKLHLQWQRNLPPLKPAYQNHRLQFDAGYEPVVLGKTMFVGSSFDDSVTALDIDTGQQKSRFYADGPVRFAPVAWNGRVFFGSDDGHLYCLDGENGKLRWKFRAVPSNRKLLGNGRLISAWPIRGGPVLADGKIFFAAGLWPFEGVFVYALNAESGDVVWLNDRTGYIYGQHPHAAEAFGGLTPQGYLVVDGDELIVPCSAALPARFDLATGKLKHFELPKSGRKPGGWFTAAGKAQRRGEESSDKNGPQFDEEINKDWHEGGWHRGPGKSGIHSIITAGEQKLSFASPIDGVSGTIHSLLVADEKLFVVTREGSIYCFGADEVKPRLHRRRKTSLRVIDDAWTANAKSILSEIRRRQGIAVVVGLVDGRLIEELARQSDLQIIGIDSDKAIVDRLRRRFDEAGVYGSRVSLIAGDPAQPGFPPYFASLVVSEKPISAVSKDQTKLVQRWFKSLRPYGGMMVLKLSEKTKAGIEQQVKEGQLRGARLKAHEKQLLLTRAGALAGSTNYTGGWNSPDQLVKAPLGVLWFGDSVGVFKRAPQPMFVDGVMISHDKIWRGYVKGDRPPYALTDATFSDVYTGRVMSKDELSEVGADLPTRDIKAKQPSQYRPPHQKDDWKPEQPVAGQRKNPLTGVTEPRAIIKSYGCDGGNDYGRLYTMRSGTAAFYDKQCESGTIHISGSRSGCTNSIIPANGVLNVPYFYQGCTCSYPLPVGLAMVNMPQEFEQWTVWGPSKPGPIERVGVNFGAPGDRMTNDGTLWLDYPSVGGPSPEINVTVEPSGDAVEYFYRHSLWIEGGRGWPWVAASGAKRVKKIMLEGLKESSYTVRLYFSEPDHDAIGKRVFDIAIQGKTVKSSCDLAEESGGTMKAHIEEFRNIESSGTMAIQFDAKRGEPLICGIELVSSELKTGTIPNLQNRSRVSW